MIKITRHLTDGCGFERPQPLVVELETRAAMARLLFDFLPNTTRVLDLTPDKIVLEVAGQRRSEIVELVAYKHLLVPLMLVVRQYLLMLEERQNFAKLSLRQLRSSSSPTIFTREAWVPAYTLPDVSLPGAEWNDLIERYPEEVAFVTALTRYIMPKYFRSLMQESPQDILYKVIEDYDHEQSEAFSERCIQS